MVVSILFGKSKLKHDRPSLGIFIVHVFGKLAAAQKVAIPELLLKRCFRFGGSHHFTHYAFPVTDLRSGQPLGADNCPPIGQRHVIALLPQRRHLRKITAQALGRTDRNDFGETLIDGENILYDKTKKYKNTYAAFDIYFVKGESVRNLNFWVNDAIEITKVIFKDLSTM